MSELNIDKQMTIPNPELQLAEEFVRHTNCNIFLTGKAGTGKTTFLHAIQKKTHKRMVVTAPTGVAAINAGGVTLHSFFQLPFGPFVPGGEVPNGQHRIRREKVNIIRSLDLLVIDEISMVRADLLDGVDSVLRRYRRSDLPFGGVQLLMIGDLQQLSPVVKKNEWQLLENYYDSPYFFSSAALSRAELVSIELKHIYRQSDPHFIELLGRVRDNRLDPPTLDKLNSRYIPNFSHRDGDGYITLCTHNKSADAINEEKLKSLPGKIRSFNAETNGDFPEHAYPTAAALEIKIGAQVMFVRNDMSFEKKYFNGKIGKITGISSDAIEVRCPGDSEKIIVEKTTWENIEYTVDSRTAEISQKVIGTFSQYPLKLAWAITIHKSQGLTFDKAIIDAQAAFAHGQVYVALSRCRSFEGMVLSSPLGPQAVKTEHTVQRFIQRLSGNAPSPEKLASEKNRYHQILMLSCFNFDKLNRLIDRFSAMLRENAALIQVTDGGDIIEFQKQVAAQICAVGEKFRRQLQGMFTGNIRPAEDPVIADRLIKASHYFKEKFDSILLPLIERIAVETDNKEIQKKISDTLKQVREETAVKTAAVLSCKDGFSPEKYLRLISAAAIDEGNSRPKAKTIVYSDKDVNHPELFEALREWRKQKAAEEGIAHYQVLHQKTLVQIAVHLPDTISALKKIKGIGKRLAEKYGEELTNLVAGFREKHGIEGEALPEPSSTELEGKSKKKPTMRQDTRQLSLELFQRGLSIPQIAGERGMAVSTIEGHLAFFVSEGELEISRIVADEKRRIIEQKIADLPSKRLKALKEALGDGYSYSEIKLVFAHLEKQ
ncbi:MAG: helix-turn-helix domain-containing protein [Desulfobacterales bacterium]|nr:helix-turn-helix domain-containing protein [Desulfobacterales bacterium]